MQTTESCVSKSYSQIKHIKVFEGYKPIGIFTYERFRGNPFDCRNWWVWEAQPPASKLCSTIKWSAINACD